MTHLKSTRKRCQWLGLGLIATLVGCNDQRVAVSGTVMLDGQPVSQAVILFVPLEAARKKTGGMITGGKFQIPREIGLLPGSYRVEVLDDPPESSASLRAAPTLRRPFPNHYASQSPLKVEISPDHGSETVLDFALRLVPGKE